MAKKAFHVKKDDLVMVIAGKERGKTGKVLKILPDKGRVLVEKLNLVKRHTRPSQQNPHGGIVEKEGSIDLSNAMVFCGKCSEPVRIGKRVLEDGKKVRVCKKCKEILDKS